MTPRLLSTALCFTSLLTAAAHADPIHADPSAAKPAPAPATAPIKAAGSSEDKIYAAQSAVAAKTAFKILPAGDKSVAAALDAKALAAAAKLAGHPGSFQGTVSSVYSPKNHSFVALDFAPHYREALTANIAPADYAKFPDLAQLAGKHVVVSGQFIAHSDATQLAVTSPDQIKIVP